MPFNGPVSLPVKTKARRIALEQTLALCAKGHASRVNIFKRLFCKAELLHRESYRFLPYRSGYNTPVRVIPESHFKRQGRETEEHNTRTVSVAKINHNYGRYLLSDIMREPPPTWHSLVESSSRPGHIQVGRM